MTFLKPNGFNTSNTALGANNFAPYCGIICTQILDPWVWTWVQIMPTVLANLFVPKAGFEVLDPLGLRTWVRIMLALKMIASRQN